MSRKKGKWILPAQNLYVKSPDITLEEISQRTGVSTRTLSKWKQDYNWDQKRQDYMVSMTGIEDKLQKITAKIVEEMDVESIDNGDLYRLVQASTAIEKIVKTVDIRKATSVVMGHFISYMQTRHPERLESFQPILSGFFDYVDEVANAR